MYVTEISLSIYIYLNISNPYITLIIYDIYIFVVKPNPVVGFRC